MVISQKRHQIFVEMFIMYLLLVLFVTLSASVSADIESFKDYNHPLDIDENGIIRPENVTR